MTAYPAELVHRQLDDPKHPRDPWVGSARPPQTRIEVVDAEPGWPRRFTVEAARITAALGSLGHAIEHVGSTSVPELPAKPIIDIDVQVPDSDDEATYLPPLQAIGFRLALREPWWNGHRMLIGPDADVFLHVFPVGAPEPLRHLLFETGSAPITMIATSMPPRSAASPMRPPSIRRRTTSPRTR